MDVIIQKLILKKSRIVTTLCTVEFKNGGYSFPIPVRFNPDNDVFNIFENSRFITKSLLQHGRYWSLHEILCDIYEKDPKTTWLSDGDFYYLSKKDTPHRKIIYSHEQKSRIVFK